MPSRSELIDEAKRASDRVASRVFAGAVGVLAFSISLLLERGQTEALSDVSTYGLAPACILALSALAFELSGALMAYRVNRSLYKELHRSGAEKIPYPEGRENRVFDICFYGKILCTVSAIFWLTIYVSVTIFQYG